MQESYKVILRGIQQAAKKAQAERGSKSAQRIQQQRQKQVEAAAKETTFDAWRLAWAVKAYEAVELEPGTYYIAIHGLNGLPGIAQTAQTDIMLRLRNCLYYGWLQGYGLASDGTPIIYTSSQQQAQKILDKAAESLYNPAKLLPAQK